MKIQPLKYKFKRNLRSENEWLIFRAKSIHYAHLGYASMFPYTK